MSPWALFHDVTKELDRVVHRPVNERNREKVIEEIENLLDQRALLIGKLRAPTEKEKYLVQQVKEWDLKIHQKLEFIFDGLKQDMRNMKKQKSSKQRYVNPYQSVTGYDGTYMDYKK